MAKYWMIGINLAKSIFQLHEATRMGEMRFHKKLSRQNLQTGF